MYKPIKNQGGFSLVEILVALVIGMFSTLAIFQTLALFESQRRTTGAAVDMQQTGLSALHTLEQDIRLGGFGLIDNGAMPCSTINASFQSTPIQIVDGGSGSDQLITTRLDSDTGGFATGGGRAQVLIPTTTTSITVDTGKALKPNEYILIAQAGACSLFKIASTYVTGTTPVAVVAQSNVAGSAGTVTIPSPIANATIIDLGLTMPFVTSTYSVSADGNLVQSDNGATTPTPLAANIVSIKAQYGVAPAGSQTINCWTEANSSGATCAPGNWSTLTPVTAARIKAIRIAVVARSALKEKPKSGTTCDATPGAPTADTAGTVSAWPSAGLPAGSSPPPDLSAIDSWPSCYRYRVYQTIVPLRNVIWGNL